MIQIAYLEEYQLVKEQSGIRMGDGTCYIEVFNLDQDAASLEKCAKEVAKQPSCGNAFFFNENKGRCFCEKHGFTCIRMDRIYVNEYILNAGESNHSIQSWVSYQKRNESITYNIIA